MKTGCSFLLVFFFSSRRRHTRYIGDWSSDVCSSDLIVLGVLYESFIHPLTIFSGLPFAGFGALLALMIFHMELSVYAFVGIIMLIGLVKKNAIMMIDFAVEAEKRGKSPREAIHEAC